MSFSTHFSQSLYESYIDFGTYRVDGLSSVADYTRLNVNQGYFYSFYPDGVQFRNPALVSAGDTSRFNVDQKIAILSTGTRYNLVPSSIQKRFFELMLKGIKYEEKNGVFYTKCSTRPASVEILVQGKWIVFAGQDTIMNLNYEDPTLT